MRPTDEEDKNVYYKRGRKYIPFGLMRGPDYLPDGIWYVRHTDHSYGTTNINHYLQGLYKVGDAPNMVDIPKLCSMHTYTEYVLADKDVQEVLRSGSYTPINFVAKIVSLVVKLNDTLKQKEKEKDGTR